VALELLKALNMTPLKCRFLVCFFFCFSLDSIFAKTESNQQTIRMGLNSSRTLHIPKVNRIAVGNSKVVKAKALSNSELLIMGKSKGISTVRVWTEEGKELRYDVRVVASEAEHSSNSLDREVVKISLEFLELDEAFSQTKGFRWPDALQFSGVAKLAGEGAFSGINYEMTFATGQAWIHHLVQEGWARVVANPDLYVRLGEEAVFHSGGEFPVATSVDNFGQSYRRVEWKDYGLTAKVLPHSIDKVHITSDVNLEISELIASQNNLGIPALTKRSLKTKMNSINGETVVLSGLVKQNNQKEKEGVPILSSIPILGPLLFSKSSQSYEKTELLMAVTFSMSTKARETEFLQQLDRKSRDFN